MSRVGVRRCDRDDVSQLAALGSKVFRATYSSSSPEDELEGHITSYFSEQAVAREITRPDVRYFMAELGETCAGLVKVCDKPRTTIVPEGKVFEVQQLYVSGDHQRRGVGRLLMDAAVDDARAGAANAIVLTVWSQADWATAFYLDYGFRSLGEVPFMVGQTEYVDWLMTLAISAAAQSVV